MRLTLRYLLGYMDGNLSPEDAQDIGQKVEESEKAKRLLHRIRDVTRRLRLGAPTVMDRGEWLDPNTVAEYLDNRLPHAQVPDFEKVCTDSDVQLAEVAACHQILSIVLREPAEIDPISRQRMYRLPETLAEKEASAAAEPDSSSSAAAAASNGHSTETGGSPPRERPTIPEYLRQPASQGRAWRTALSLALAVGIVLLVLALLGQFRPGTFLGGLLRPASGPSEKPLARENGDAPNTEAPGEPAEERTPAEEPLADGRASLPSGAIPAGPRLEPPAASPAGRPVPSAAKPNGQDAPPAKPAMAPPEKPKEPSATPGDADPATGGSALKQPPGALQPSARIPGGDPDRGPGAFTARPLPPVEQLGEVLTANEVLLKLNATTGSWQRLAEHGPILSRDQLLSLPAFRPAISLAARVQIKLIDGTHVGFLSSGEQGVPGIAVNYGRIVVRPEEGAKPRLRLQIGDRMGILAFEDSESTLAIDVGRTESVGSDPETQPGPIVADLYATTGRMVWQEEPAGKPVALTAPIRATLSEHTLDTVALQQFPRWVFDTSLGTLEQRTAGTVERALSADRPIHLGLRELAGHRQKEVRGLALRSLAYAEDYEPLLAVLNDADGRLQWPDHIDQLRAALVRGPHSAGQIRMTMEKLYGDEGTRLYEMLWKYRAESLTPAEARQLIKFLDHEALIFRVLSFWNLKTMTGLTLHYRPEDTAAKRQPAILKWKERQNTLPSLRPRPPSDEEKAREPEPPPSMPPRKEAPKDVKKSPEEMEQDLPAEELPFTGLR